MRVRASIVAVEKQWVCCIFCVCVCSVRYPARNAHAPYCQLWPAPLYNIFRTLSHKRYDIRKKVTERKMCVLVFCTAFVWNISHSKKNWARCDTKLYIGLHVQCRPCISVCMYSAGYACQILNETWKFIDKFSKNTHIPKFIKIRPVGAEVSRGDGRTDMN
jgi:hypothetical protein